MILREAGPVQIDRRAKQKPHQAGLDGALS